MVWLMSRRIMIHLEMSYHAVNIGPNASTSMESYIFMVENRMETEVITSCYLQEIFIPISMIIIVRLNS